MSEEADSPLPDFAEEIKNAIVEGDQKRLKSAIKNCGSMAKDALELPCFEFVLPSFALDKVTCLHIVGLKARPEFLLIILGSVPHLDIDVLSVTHGWTPLHCAVGCGDMEVTPNLLDAGADLNAATNQGETPIHIAVATEKYDMAMCLLEIDADLGFQDNKGNTILHLCVLNNEFSKQNVGKEATEFLDELLKRGFPVNEQNSHGDTPIHLCARGNANLNILKLLLACGGTSSLFIPNKNGNIPLHLAQNEAIVKMLCKGDGVNMINYKANDGRTALHMNSNKPEMLRTLMEFGADANLVDLQRRLPLHTVFSKDGLSIEAVKLLVEVTSNVDSTDIAGHSPLHVLCGTSHDCQKTQETDDECKTQILIKMLGSYGANVNLQSKKGSTPLHHVLKLGHHHAADTLMDLGADPDLLDSKDRSPKYIDPRWYSCYRKMKRKMRQDEMDSITNEFEEIAEAWSQRKDQETKTEATEEVPRALSRQLTTLHAEMQEVKDVLQELESESVMKETQSEVVQDQERSSKDEERENTDLNKTVENLRSEMETLTRSLTILIAGDDENESDSSD